MQLSSFTKLRFIWYLDNVKIVLSNIKELLIPFALVYWIMVDGSKYNEGLYLSFYSFSTSYVYLLVSAITNNFNLSCSLLNTNKRSKIYNNKINKYFKTFSCRTFYSIYEK